MSGETVELKLLSDLRVTELKQELEKRNLDKNGIKIILADRLEKAIRADGCDPNTFLFNTSESAGTGQQSADEGAPAVASPVAEEPTKEPSADEPVDLDSVPTSGQESVAEVNTCVNDTDAINSPKAADESLHVEVKSDAPAANSTDEVKVEEDVKPNTPTPAVVQVSPLPTAAAAKIETPMDTDQHPEEEEQLEDPLNEPQEAPKPAPVPTVTTTTHDTAADEKKKEEVEREVVQRSFWVRGLSISTKAADLKSLFSEVGKVIRAKIFTAKKSQQSTTCFGYVTMSDKDLAEKCVEQWNKKQWRGRMMTVEKADKSRISMTKAAAAAAIPPRREAPKKDEPKKAEKRDDKKDPPKRDDKDKEPRKEQAGSSTATGSTAAVDKDKARSIKDSRPPRRDSERVAGRPRLERTDDRRAVAHDSRRDARKSIQAPRRFTTAPSSSYRTGFSARISRPVAAQSGPRRHEPDHRDMMELLRRKEEEHRRREMELELEREREKIRFEREKVEREKLEMQLQMALQQQQLVALQSRSRDAQFAVPAMPSRTRTSDTRSHQSTRDRDSRDKQNVSSSGRSTSSRSGTDSRRPHVTSGTSSSRHITSERVTSSSGRSSDRSGRTDARSNGNSHDRSRSRPDSYATSSSTSSRHGHGHSSITGSSVYGTGNAYSSSTRDSTIGSSSLDSAYFGARDAYSGSSSGRDNYGGSSSRVAGSGGSWAGSGGPSSSTYGATSTAWPTGSSVLSSAWSSAGRSAGGSSDSWTGFTGTSSGLGSSSSSGRVEYDKFPRRY